MPARPEKGQSEGLPLSDQGRGQDGEKARNPLSDSHNSTRTELLLSRRRFAAYTRLHQKKEDDGNSENESEIWQRVWCYQLRLYIFHLLLVLTGAVALVGINNGNIEINLFLLFFELLIYLTLVFGRLVIEDIRNKDK